ncbi:hypothetical protein PG996_013104 [Apiospora saccharicola]|uniref:F-box domain-containing protein n=1 Tax=Apiospora saccharicola TaxID=335842 RepID=A0ABR1U4I2_9PEZI
MDLITNSSGSSDGESDSGETTYANRSKWHTKGGGSNESTAPEDTGSSGRDNGEGPSRRSAAAGGSPDDDDGSDDDDDDDDDDHGETNYANRSKYSPTEDGGDDSPEPEETGGNVRDNGEGPSRQMAVAGGSPDDPDSSDDGGGGEVDYDGDDGDDESDDSGYASGGRRRKSRHHEDSDDEDTARDPSVMPDVIDDDSDDEAYYSDDGEDITLWPHERLIVKYKQKLDKIRAIKISTRRKIQGIQRRAKARVDDLKATIDEQEVVIEDRDATIDGLENRINGLGREIQGLRDRLNGVRPPPTPWDQLLGNKPYGLVYRVACQQLNMSQVITNVHPQLHLSTRKLTQAQMAAAYGLNGGGGGNGNGNGNDDRADSMSIDDERDGHHGDSDSESELFVQQDPSPPPAGQDERPRRPFPFNRLDRDIQERIFRYLFVKKDLVHCLSRLDPGNEPLVARPLQRFFWGGENRDCCVTLAHRPNSVLRLLLVCKRWLYLGVHAFYGLNTFAFSSLGELGRFMKGIGSRLERIVNVELFWHGAIMPRQVSMVNQRTLPLQFFCDTRRLKTLVIHLQELDERRTRRKYEIREEDDVNDGSGVPYPGSRLDLKDPFKVLMDSTRVQPNHRQYRNIRTMHGLDFVYQLRDMNYVRLREAQGNTARQKIRDWSIIDDINSVVTRSKDPDYAFKSELENLSPISGLSNFVPTEDDKQIVRRWYADNEPMGSVIGEDDDGDTISVISSEAHSTDDDDDGSDDDDPNSPSGNDDSGIDVGDDNDSSADVDMDTDNDSHDDSPSEAGSAQGDDDLDPEPAEDDDEAVEGINDDLEQMSINDDEDSESIDEDVGDDLENISTATDNSSDSDGDSPPHDTGTTGITSGYDTSVNAAGTGPSQISRPRANTVSSSSADAGDDAGDMGIANANEDENKKEEDDDGGSQSSGIFVSQRAGSCAESSLFVRSDRGSTVFKTESEEEKKRIIDLTSDDNAGPSRSRGHTSDALTSIKEESSSGGGGPSRPRARNARLAGANYNAPMNIDDDSDDNKPSQSSEHTLDVSDAQSTSSSWKYKPSPSPSGPAYLKRQSNSPSEDERNAKRQRANTPSESGRVSEVGSTPETPISID